MKCPFCNHYFTIVVDTRPAEEGTKIKRRRKCLKCEDKFTTFEIKEEAITKEG